MKRSAAISIVFALLIGCAPDSRPVSDTSTSKPSETAAKMTQAMPDLKLAGYELGNPVEVGDTMIIPIRDKRQEPEQQGGTDYLTLEQATKLGVIQIEELPDEVVEMLIVRNTGDKPILLVGGDLLLGGNQDRVVARDVIVPPGKAVKVDVYCVEQGRWHGESVNFSYGGSKTTMMVKQSAIVAKDQSRVWDEVQRFNDAKAVRGRSTINAGMEAARESSMFETHRAALLNALKGERRVVGLVVVRNGQIVGMEVFGSPKLFDASRESLLNSLLVEVSPKPEKAPSLDNAILTGFVSQALTPLRSSVAGERERDEEDLEGVELHASSGGAGKSVFVHGTYFPKKQ